MFSLQLAAVYVADEHIAWGMRDQKVRFSLSGYVLGCDTAGPKDWNLVRTDIQRITIIRVEHILDTDGIRIANLDGSRCGREGYP